MIGGAVRFMFRVGIRLSATLLGIMFFCVVQMMSLPAAIAAPQRRFAWTLAARESAFSAGAILLAITSGARERTGENRVAIGALYLIALVSMFYGIEHFLHPECVPAVPLAKKTPLWIPFAHLWPVPTGIIMVIGARSMFDRNVRRQSPAPIARWVVVLRASPFPASIISQTDL